MIVKKMSMVLCFGVCSVYASDNDVALSLFDQVDVLQEAGPVVSSIVSPMTPVRIEPAEHPLAAFECQSDRSFYDALQAVGGKLCASLVLIGNSFGRLALSGYLGYKSYICVKKAYVAEAPSRNKQIIKALCYCAAACMLLQDGYAWVLQQGASQ